MDFFGHLRTINHHKMLVTKTCFKVGLYWQGICHDLSKYHPIEFIPRKRLKGIPGAGCITKEEISIILSTGLITVSVPVVWWG